MSMEADFAKSPAFLELQPLRIPAGWAVAWNSLYASSKAESGDFGGSSLFYAVNEGRRFSIDVGFEPEFDPEGHFHLTVTYQPWPRNERGRRMSDEPFRLDAKAEVVHSAETQSYADLVALLETWIARCTVWVREGH
jgi:hypothetical protein